MKKLSKETIYTIIHNANNKQFVESLNDDTRQWLIDDVKDRKPERCLCCPCFAWEFDEDNKISGCTCTLNGIPSEDGKGQCNFD